jgi:hypothetical protein
MMTKEGRSVSWPAIIIIFFPASIFYYIGKKIACELGASSAVAIGVGAGFFVVPCVLLGLILAKYFPDNKNSN